MKNLLAKAASRSGAALRRHGFLAALRLAAQAARRNLDFRETFVWLELRFDTLGAPATLPEGFALVEVGPAQDAPFHALAPHARRATTRYRSRGGRPYVVMSGDRAAFTCWIHPRCAPLRALPARFLELPDGVVCLEDSVADTDFRGHGIAPRTWTMLATRLRDEGFGSMITKVLDTNVPSLKAVEKAGFVEVARMRVRQHGPYVRLRVEATAGGAGPALADRLDGAWTILRPEDAAWAAGDEED